jgi:hypothetical protein
MNAHSEILRCNMPSFPRRFPPPSLPRRNDHAQARNRLLDFFGRVGVIAIVAIVLMKVAAALESRLLLHDGA